MTKSRAAAQPDDVKRITGLLEEGQQYARNGYEGELLALGVGVTIARHQVHDGKPTAALKKILGDGKRSPYRALVRLIFYGGAAGEMRADHTIEEPFISEAKLTRQAQLIEACAARGIMPIEAAKEWKGNGGLIGFIDAWKIEGGGKKKTKEGKPFGRPSKADERRVEGERKEGRMAGETAGYWQGFSDAAEEAMCDPARHNLNGLDRNSARYAEGWREAFDGAYRLAYRRGRDEMARGEKEGRDQGEAQGKQDALDGWSNDPGRHQMREDINEEDDNVAYHAGWRRGFEDAYASAYFINKQPEPPKARAQAEKSSRVTIAQPVEPTPRTIYTMMKHEMPPEGSVMLMLAVIVGQRIEVKAMVHGDALEQEDIARAVAWLNLGVRNQA